MKKIIYLSLIVGLFLAACSTSRNGFTKRKYTKGVFVESKGRATSPKEKELAKNTTSRPKQVVSPEVTVEKIAVSDNQNVNTSVLTADAKSSDISVGQHNKVSVFEKNTTSVSVDANEKTTVKSVLAVKKAAKKLKKANSHSSADTNLILLVILSLFPILALIAIYLKDGDITLNFWVDLILHFVFLYWLFALLVVLDVIDLG